MPIIPKIKRHNTSLLVSISTNSKEGKGGDKRNLKASSYCFTFFSLEKYKHEAVELGRVASLQGIVYSRHNITRLMPLLLIHFLRIHFTLIPSPWLGEFANVSCSQQSNIEETEQALKGNDEVIADKENTINEKIEMIKSLSTEIGLFTGSG